MKRFLHVIFLAVMCFFAVNVSAREYTMDEYLAMVERNNPDLLTMLKDIELAKTSATMARSVFFPRAGIQGGYNRNFIEQTQSTAVASTGPGPLVFQDIRSNFDNELIFGVGLSQVLFSAGAISNYNKAKLGQAIREQSFKAARQAIICAAKKLYVRAQLTLLVVEIMESSERFSLEQYQRVERRYNVGASTEMDLLSAEVNWRSKTDAVMEAKKNAELVLLALRDLAGIPHSETVSLIQTHTNLPEIPGIPNMDSILANRADFRSILLFHDLTGLERKAARNAFIPEISASFNYALGYMNGNSDVPSNDYDFNSASLGITINIPIMAGGARLANMKAAKLQQEKSLIALSQKKTAIESELLELQLRLHDAHQRFESSLRTVETARRAVALAQSAYTNGQATYLNVADAQDKMDLVWLNFANVNAEYLSAYFDWELATGD